MDAILNQHQQVKSEICHRSCCLGPATCITALALVVIFSAGMICLIPGVNAASVLLPSMIPSGVVILLSLPIMIRYCRPSNTREDLLDLAQAFLESELPGDCPAAGPKMTDPNGRWIVQSIMPRERNDRYDQTFLNHLKTRYPSKENERSDRQNEIVKALDAAIKLVGSRDNDD